MYVSMYREDLQKGQLARRCLAQAASPGRDSVHAEGKRPSAAEWVGLKSSPATAAVAAGSACRRKSAAEWCANAADRPGLPAQGEGPAEHMGEGAEDKEEEAAAGAGSRRGVCAEERGQGDDTLGECEEGRETDDSEESWPKLDINSQHFSSKPEPIVLGQDPPAQVPLSRMCSLIECVLL